MIKSTCCCDTDLHIFHKQIAYRNESVFREYEGTMIAKCSACGILKTFVPKTSLFNPKNSNAEFYEKNKDLFTRLFGPTIAGICAYKKYGNVLDIGCSSGILLEILRKRGFGVFGLEPTKKAFLIARKKLGNTIIQSTLEMYKTKKKFDIIIFSHVLEHLPDPQETLQKAKSLLTADGIMVIGIPNVRNIIFLMRGKYWEYLRPGEHVWHFSDRSLISLLKKNGFTVLKSWYVNDERNDYPRYKRWYFNFLNFLNRVFKTGETVSLICKKL